MRKPAAWQFLVAALLLMAVGGGVTYWVQVSRLQAEWVSWVPIRPVELKADLSEVELLEQRISQGDPSAVAELGEVYQRIGHDAAALQCFDTMIGLEPTNPQWLLDAATAIRSDQPREAKIRLKRARQLGLPDAESYLYAGNLSAVLGDQVQSMSDYERAVELDPTLDQVWFRLITLYRAIGDTGPARRALISGLEANPDSVVLLRDRGVQLLERKQWSRALADFEQIIEIDPSQESIYEAAAASLYYQNRREEGDAKLMALLKFNPENAKAFRGLCQSAIVAGNQEAANRWFGKFLDRQSYSDFRVWQGAKLFGKQLAESFEGAFGETPANAERLLAPYSLRVPATPNQGDSGEYPSETP